MNLLNENHNNPPPSPKLLQHHLVFFILGSLLTVYPVRGIQAHRKISPIQWLNRFKNCFQVRCNL